MLVILWRNKVPDVMYYKFLLPTECSTVGATLAMTELLETKKVLKSNYIIRII